MEVAEIRQVVCDILEGEKKLSGSVLAGFERELHVSLHMAPLLRLRVPVQIICDGASPCFLLIL